MDNLSSLSSISNKKTSGIRSEHISIFWQDSFLDSNQQTIKYPAIVYSILAVNSSDEDIFISCYAIDGSETANDLNRTFLVYNRMIPRGENLEIVKNNIFLTENDSLVAFCESSTHICDFLVSFSYIFN